MADPSTISDLALHLEADALTGLADGDPVTTWTATVGNNATQATAAKKPLYKTGIIGGLPVLRFDGTDDAMQVASVSLSMAFTLFVVVVNNNNAAVRIIAERSANATAGTGSYLSNRSSQTIYARANGSASGYNAAVTWLNTAAHVATQTANDTHATHALYLDGTAVSLTAALSADPGAATGTDTLNIGSRNAASLFYPGDIAEVIFYTRALTPTERATVHSYIQDKYGITVSDYTSGGVTGTAAWTEDDGVLAATGGQDIPGTTAWAEDDDQAAASGTQTITGTTGWTEDNDTLTGSDGGATSGTITWAETDDTITATGGQTITGTATWTEADDALLAAATQTILATLTWAEDHDQITAAGDGNAAPTVPGRMTTTVTPVGRMTTTVTPVGRMTTTVTP